MKIKQKKIKYTNLFFLIILIYIFVQVANFSIGYFTPTEVLKSKSIDLGFREKGLIVFDEQILKSDIDGEVIYHVEDNKRVQKNQIIASVDSSSKYNNITEDISKLENDIKKLQKENKNINSNILLNKKEELKILNYKKKKYYTDYKSDESALVSFKYDDYYEKLDVESINNISTNLINSIENNFKNVPESNSKIKKGQVLARLINPENTYVCFVTDENLLNQGQDVMLKLKNQEIEGSVYKIYKENKKNIIIIKILNQNSIIYDTRIAEFDIIYKKMEGFKIPLESTVIENNSLGIYVINEDTKMPYFVDLNKKYYKDEKNIYVAYNGDKGKFNINLYDRILLHPNCINKNIKVSR